MKGLILRDIAMLHEQNRKAWGNVRPSVIAAALREYADGIEKTASIDKRVTPEYDPIIEARRRLFDGSIMLGKTDVVNLKG